MLKSILSRKTKWNNFYKSIFDLNMGCETKTKKHDAITSLKKHHRTPGKNQPSICDLECSDWYRIFWTLKNESDVFTLAEDLSEFLRMFKGCKELSRCTNDSYVPTVNYNMKFKGKKSLDLSRVSGHCHFFLSFFFCYYQAYVLIKPN